MAVSWAPSFPFVRDSAHLPSNDLSLRADEVGSSDQAHRGIIMVVREKEARERNHKSVRMNFSVNRVMLVCRAVGRNNRGKARN